MKKRIISFLLVFCMLFSSLPMTALAARFEQRTDAAEPYLEIKKAKSGNECTVMPHNAPAGSAVYFASYDEDGRMLDVEIWPATNDSHPFVGDEEAEYAKVFLVDQETLEPLSESHRVLMNTNTFTVSFYDGDRLIETMEAEEGEPLGAVPAVDKSSRANAILLGYYTDSALTQPFYAENPVTGDMNVYAKYEEMGSTEELNFTSFARMDQAPGVTFEVVGTGSPENNVTLEVMDGSDPVELAFTSTGSGYVVYAPAGFNEGCSYQLHLADGWTFKDKPDTIRSASFSIAMEEVFDMQMGDDIIYIQDTDEIKYSVGGQSHDVLTSDMVTEAGGSFNYSGNVSVGDLVCLYVGVHPEAREGNSDVLDPAVYVKIKSVNANTVGFEPLGEEDQMKLYDIPNNFPIIVSALPTENTGTVNISALDESLYAMMMGEGYGLNEAKEAIGVGDFISMYVSQDGIESEDDIFFGKITAYNTADGTITYEKTTSEAIENSMNLYSEVEVEGNDILSEEEKEEIETAVYAQVRNSSFAEDAAFMLADLVTETDGFKNGQGIQDLIVKNASGNELTSEQIELLNLGGNFELSDEIKLTVELITEGDQLHYENGIQLAIGIEAEFEVELESEDKINIELSAVFVQEVMIDPKVKGDLVYKKVLKFIPVPNGVKVGATIDLKSFTAFSFDATIYTVAAEDQYSWETFKEFAKKELKNLGIEIPEELVEGAKTVKELVDKAKEYEKKAKEIQGKVEAFEGGAEQAAKYMEDAASIYSALEENGISWKTLEESFGATNVASDLMDMMNLSNETGLTTDYYDSMEALMERYCEMLEQESDWITLVEEEMGRFEVSYYAISVGVTLDFMVRADMSLAIGSNLEYEIGKRYDFWFKIGLFKPSAGSSTMDILDESFAFQFYVMGRLGLKAGVKATLFFGIGSGEVASVGINMELGPYVKLYGFFIYEYTKHRPANTNTWINEERMMGALYMEFGLYFMMGFETEAVKFFEYSCDFLDEEIPLLTAGDERYYYQFDFAPAEDETVVVRDEDDNSGNGITMKLPDNLIGMKYVSLENGFVAVETLDYDKYVFTLSNPNFTFNKKTGVITVNVPDGTRYMECDLVATYKHGKMAFSSYDMAVTIPLVWTNMTDAELNEYYTASVRVGNNSDGFATVWSQRVLKNQEFDLPTADEIKEIIGWNDYKYEMAGGYGSQQLTGLTLVDNKTYDFVVDYKTYSITVNDVQNASGSTTSKTFTAKFGETFDFSALESTGTTDYADGVFTKFSELTAPEGIDLSKAIDTRMAAALASGVTATANYVDNSVTATFAFTGIDADDVTVTLRRGDIPALDAVEAVLNDYGMAIVDIFPAVGAMNASGTYQVVCGELDTAPATITFVENGGSDVEDITKPYGSLIGTLPAPEKTGCTFVGWYEDEGLTTEFTDTKMPEGGITLYAKWTVSDYTVTFHVNGGDALADDEITVTYGAPYGELPKAQRTGYGFIGWFTAAVGGDPITAESIYAIDGNQTLYAQWRELQEIPASVFTFAPKSVDYQPKTYVQAEYTYNAADNSGYDLNDFTIEYLCEGYEDEGYLPADEVHEAGTYSVRITRPADDYYAKFEHTYDAVLTIAKIVRDGGTPCVGMVDDAYVDFDSPVQQTLTSVSVRLVATGTNGHYLKDPDPDLKVRLAAFAHKDDRYTSTPDISTAISVSDYVAYPEAGQLLNNAFTYSQFIPVYGLEPATQYSFFLEVTGDRNYEDMYFEIYDCEDIGNTSMNYLHKHIATKEAPVDSWADYADTSWYNTTDTEFVITTPEQLAGFAQIVNGFDYDAWDSSENQTIKLGADIDMSAHRWVPIGVVGTDYANFFGVFDGDGHTISGLYCNQPTKSNIGLFAYATGVVQNVVVDDSYFYGKSNVGSIAGIGFDGVYNCVNYATVRADQESKDNNYRSVAGGIVGEADGEIINCVNYGRVYAQGRLVGGIAGYCDYIAVIANNVNFGSVTGSSRVGGIVGCTETDDGSEALFVYNNYNVGTVRPRDGSDDYIGAIVGRNMNDNAIVQYNYYLLGCAKGGDGESRQAMGKEGGTVVDGSTSEGQTYYASYFETPASKMNGNAEKYAELTLIGALNAWVDTESGTYADIPVSWEATGPDGYPLPVGTLTSALRK